MTELLPETVPQLVLLQFHLVVDTVRVGVGVRVGRQTDVHRVLFPPVIDGQLQSVIRVTVLPGTGWAQSFVNDWNWALSHPLMVEHLLQLKELGVGVRVGHGVPVCSRSRWRSDPPVEAVY